VLGESGISFMLSKELERAGCGEVTWISNMGELGM
jgi:hypothetical protein